MQEIRLINGVPYQKGADGIIRRVDSPALSGVPALPTATPLPVNPVRAAKEARQEARAEEDQSFQRQTAIRTAGASERTAGAAERTEARTMDNDKASRIRGLAGDYNSDATVKSYRVAIAQLGQSLNTEASPAGDLSLTYAFAKAMDPESVVRESEQGMVTNTQPWFQAAVLNAQKQFGMDGAGSFTPEAREALRRQIDNSVAQRSKVYSARRSYFDKQAKALDVDPSVVLGEHDATPFYPQLKEWGQRRRDKKAAATLGQIGAAKPASGEAPPIEVEIVGGGVGGPNPSPGAEGYEDSYVSQGLSGINKGVANIAGAPVDLLTGAINLGSTGINALANTRIPSIDNPLGGSQSIKNGMRWLGSIGNESDDPSKRFVNRVGESVGSALPFASTMGSLARGGSALAAATGGGVGAATAQQAFPGNPFAEMAGEVIGGGATGAGLLGLARRNATRQIEAAVPSSDDLREQAGQLYRQAENRGVVADPQDTATLANTLRTKLTEEGLISPTGRLNDVYPKARQAMLLADDYAGGPMNPTQMQTVRKMAADGLSSPEATERRLGGIITKAIDDWAAPMAPELSQARGVARRYLEAGELETARELAGARASQFTGSGFENALRTDYRALDRGQVKGQNHFSEPVAEAIRTVARGTPLSNFARGLGRLAPTGPVSGLGSLVPAGLMMSATGSTMAGGLTGAALAGIGTAGRGVATNMGMRAADQAELIARNGGALPRANVMTPEVERMINWLAASQASNYIPQ